MKTIQTTRLYSLAWWIVGILFLCPLLAVSCYVYTRQSENNLFYLLSLWIPGLLGGVVWFLLYKISLQFSKEVTDLEQRSIPHLPRSSPSPESLETLTQLNQTVLKNTQVLEGLGEKISILTEAAELSSQIPDLANLLKIVLKKAMMISRSTKGTILLKRKDGSGLEVIAAEGWTPNLAGPIDITDSLAGKVIESGQPFLSTLTQEDHPSPSTQAGNPKAPTGNQTKQYSSPSFLILPVSITGETLGALCLSEKDNDIFTEQDQQFVMVYLNQVRYAVENARLLQKAQDRILSFEETTYLQSSQLQNAHKMILRADRLSVLGQLVAGVAHEINNPLTSVLGYTQMLFEELTAEFAEGVQESGSLERNTHRLRQLRTVFEEANRAARIILNLLTFAHENRPGRVPVQLNELIRNVTNLRLYDLRMKNIDISCELDPDPRPVLLFAGRLQQALLNLISNSADAMTSKGARKIRLGTSHTADELLIWIADTGKGIPEIIRAQIFEPFFSTRVDFSHTGLGLSIVKDIVNEHGGQIEVASVEGQGTRITLHLPLLTATHPEPGEALPAEPTISRFENKFALSIDDEIENARLVAAILERMGFHVDVINDSPQALRRLIQENFDLVVCDIRMPELDGRQLFRDLKKMRPRTIPRMIFTSGDAADPEAQLFAENNHLRLIAKPFVSQDIIRAVQEEFLDKPLTQRTKG